ncbi:hypothetical protein [Cerasicoccus arenae]|uniref:Lipoprotein n=1 Tax=Cerasicoccus arenae TaxID=424488 RepID=A0A8J3D8N6_9BACT|nr:hypothetical protein [Cerasicoccus arenae]MBK1856890.1 hypothetical protein [Cerasicoccus arenae]GHB89683.1 hypothetical protein GCM10007047_00150 [Cerasicoccus arenae]
MKTIHSIFIISLIGLSLLVGGCESTPLTPQQKEAYQKDQAILNYQNQQEANEMQYLDGDSIQDGRQLNP